MKQILLKPIITEKALGKVHDGVYVFRVLKSVNKCEVAGAIKELYKVEVKKVNIVNLKEESMLSRGKFPATKKSWKKAIITLKKGQKISGFEEK